MRGRRSGSSNGLRQAIRNVDVGVWHLCFFFSSRGRHTRCLSDWSSDVCSSDLRGGPAAGGAGGAGGGVGLAATLAEREAPRSASVAAKRRGSASALGELERLAGALAAVDRKSACREREEIAGGCGAVQTKREEE